MVDDLLCLRCFVCVWSVGMCCVVCGCFFVCEGFGEVRYECFGRCGGGVLWSGDVVTLWQGR